VNSGISSSSLALWSMPSRVSALRLFGGSAMLPAQSSSSLLSV
jgi:hypothetical protein